MTSYEPPGRSGEQDRPSPMSPPLAPQFGYGEPAPTSPPLGESQPPPPYGQGYPPPPFQRGPNQFPRALPWVIAAGFALVVLLVAMAIISNRNDDDDDTAAPSRIPSDTFELPPDFSPPSEGPPLPDDFVIGADDIENPPEEDIELTGCGGGVGDPMAEELGSRYVGAEGTITNHTADTSSYYFSVEFVDAEGTRYGEGFGAATAVAPDQTVEWTAPGMVEVRPGTECRIIEVGRHAP